MDLSLRTESFGQDDQSWLGSEHGTSSARSITLDKSAFNSGTHYPDGYFKSGIPLGRITASGLYGPYTSGATNGTQTLAGFLFTAVPVRTSADVDPVGAMLDHGRVVEARLPVPVDAAGKTSVGTRIIFA